MDRGLEKLFPSDLYGRIALGLASLIFGPMFGIGALALFNMRPQGVLDWILVLTAEELLIALSLFFACDLIWALAKPRWMEQFLNVITRKLFIAVLLFMVPFIAFVTDRCAKVVKYTGY